MRRGVNRANRMIRVVEGIDGARTATGTVVVIDVLRAFTTAAYTFAAGITEIELVATVEEALAADGFRLGEVGGRLIPGFDHNNSPSQLADRRLSGRAVQRTGSGTQCVVSATAADEIWLGSLVVAAATVQSIADRDEITLVVSGAPDEGEEDRACAVYLEALLRGAPAPRQEVIAAVRNSRAAQKHIASDVDRPWADVECSTAIDAFPFAMKVDSRDGRLVARPHF